MTVLTLGPDGEQTCEECAIDFCNSRGYICETRECECPCKVMPLTADHFDLAETIPGKTLHPQEVDKETAGHRTTSV